MAARRLARVCAFGPVLAASLALAGCAGSYCARSTALAEDCDNDDYFAADPDTCEAALASCSTEDEKQLNRYLDCVEDSGVCDATQDESDAWEAAFACLGEVEELSGECAGFGP